MRVGNSSSNSYRRLYQRRRTRLCVEREHLCRRLDRLVERAESFGRGTQTRAALMERADRVREKLRMVDH